MKKSILSFVLLVMACLLSVASEARARRIKVTTDEGATIFLNGKQVSQPVRIVLDGRDEAYLKIVKVGYLTQERNYTYQNIAEKKEEYIKLEKDDAYENSFVTNLANQDIDIRTSRKEDEAWTILNRIVTNSFDVVSITDKTTGYLCTAWSVKSFKGGVTRTRLILKTQSTDPLVYKAKLVSEYAPPGTGANADEAFSKWDRVLRTYENVIPELQSRLGK
ncbi:hypothetical protein [Niabella hirudinis]|uniref:hypothetical protein n=1 Tax=Niabella hirudinis TaxID=1285929 RepID=UPI003EC136AD